jgi:hypothetical protein
MWIWGREFLSKRPPASSKNGASKNEPRQLESDKHWLHTLLWGRLGYDPTLDNQRIAALVSQRFPGVDGGRLLAAWQQASMVYPLVTGFHWADFDFQWYIEGCRSRPGPARTASGFHSVETFIHQPAHPGTDNIPIAAFVAGASQGTTPLQVAAAIEAHAVAALGGIDTLTAVSGKATDELSETREDIRALALLGRYYAAKIRGATSLAFFRGTRESRHQLEAVDHLTRAQEFWKEYTARMGARYRNPVWTNRVGYVDWEELDAEVAADIAIASAPLP